MAAEWRRKQDVDQTRLGDFLGRRRRPGSEMNRQLVKWTDVTQTSSTLSTAAIAIAKAERRE